MELGRAEIRIVFIHIASFLSPGVLNYFGMKYAVVMAHFFQFQS